MEQQPLPGDTSPVGLSSKATCIIGPGDTVTTLADGTTKKQDGTIVDLRNCQLNPGATILFDDDDHPVVKNKAKVYPKPTKQMALPTQASSSVNDNIELSVQPTNVLNEPTITHIVAVPNDNNISSLPQPNNGTTLTDGAIIIGAIAAVSVAASALSASSTSISKRSRRSNSTTKSRSVEKSSTNQSSERQKKEQDKCNANSNAVAQVIDEVSIIASSSHIHSVVIEPDKQFADTLQDLSGDIKKLASRVKKLQQKLDDKGDQ